MAQANGMPAEKALRLLKAGNMHYAETAQGTGNISAEQRRYTAENGQDPFAIVVTCSDSRVIPEVIFDIGIGDLFVVRVAGNVLDHIQLGSIEYAASHLKVNLILILGHTHCGAVDAAINDNPQGYIKYVTDEIKEAIGDETDPYEACHLNVRRSMEIIENSLEVQQVKHEYGLKVRGAIYDIETGKVDFLPDDISQE